MLDWLIYTAARLMPETTAPGRTGVSYPAIQNNGMDETRWGWMFRDLDGLYEEGERSRGIERLMDRHWLSSRDAWLVLKKWKQTYDPKKSPEERAKMALS